MKISRTLALAAVSLKAQKMRAFLASVGIMIGIASVIVMVAIGKGSQKEVLDVISQMGENLITVNAGEAKRRGGKLRFMDSVTTLTARDAIAVANDIPEVARVAPYEYKETKVKFRSLVTPVTISGSTPEFLSVRKYRVERGRFFSRRDLETARRVAVIGVTTVKNIFGEEDPVGQIVRVEAIPFTVIGVFEPKGMDADGVDQDEIMMIPLTTLMRRLLNQTYIRTVYFQAESKQAMDTAVDKIKWALREQHRLRDDQEDDFTVKSQKDLELLKKETSELFTSLIVGVAAISLIVGGIGILAVMLASVKERTREIGVRRAVGASRLDVIQQFLMESVLIGLLGGSVGVMVGVGLSLGLTRWGPWTLIVDQKSVVIAASVCIIIGIIFGLYPAFKASRLDPMEALITE